MDQVLPAALLSRQSQQLAAIEPLSSHVRRGELVVEMKLDYFRGTGDGRNHTEKARVRGLKVCDTSVRGASGVSDLDPKPILNHVDEAGSRDLRRRRRVVDDYDPSRHEIVDLERIALGIPRQAPNGGTDCVAKARAFPGRSTFRRKAGGGCSTGIRLVEWFGPLRLRPREDAGRL